MLKIWLAILHIYTYVANIYIEKCVRNGGAETCGFSKETWLVYGKPLGTFPAKVSSFDGRESSVHRRVVPCSYAFKPRDRKDYHLFTENDGDCARVSERGGWFTGQIDRGTFGLRHKRIFAHLQYTHMGKLISATVSFKTRTSVMLNPSYSGNDQKYCQILKYQHSLNYRAIVVWIW